MSPSRPTRTRRTRPGRLLLGAAAWGAATVLSACSTPAPAPQSVAAAEPTTATTTDSGGALGAVPGSKDDSTKSFRLTSSTYTVKGDKTDGPHKASCADGYYVRAAPGGSLNKRKHPFIWTKPADQHQSQTQTRLIDKPLGVLPCGQNAHMWTKSARGRRGWPNVPSIRRAHSPEAIRWCRV